MAKYLLVFCSFSFFIVIYLVLYYVPGHGFEWLPEEIKKTCSPYEDHAKLGKFFCTREHDPILGPDGKMHGNVCSMCQAYFQAKAKEKRNAESRVRNKRASETELPYTIMYNQFQEEEEKEGK